MSEVQRIAILGGGMASLATALELTAEPDWSSRYEITVYQMGWRLGGKGASSRNHEVGERVEEHGLHVWFGCYDRAFSLLRRCYEELGRPPGTPLASVEDAFSPKDETPYFELVDGAWTVWPMWFPPTPERPGTGRPERSAWDYLVMTFEVLARADRGLLPRHGGAGRLQHVETGRRRPLARHHHLLLRLARRLARSMSNDPARHHRLQHHGLLWLLGRARTWAFLHLEEAASSTTAVRRALVELDLALTMAIGCLRDGVAVGGFDGIDDEDLRVWLGRHGAAPASVASTPVRALYDLYFAYAGGDTETPSFSAGVAINAVLRLALAYQGSVVYEMRAGMGEVVIGPVYETLAARGVKFAFFHRVERLELDADRTRVARIHLARQVDLLDGSDTGYQPLTPPIKGVRCWPAAPLADQIRDGHLLPGTDLESRWSGWTDAGHRTLEVGEDFDVAVLGISLAGLPDLVADFRADPRWRDLLDHLGTIQTQSIQLWLDSSLDELGWADGPLPTDAAPEPLDVWADRTEVLAFEDWPAPGPRSLQYLCGPMIGDTYLRPRSDRSAPGEALDDVTATLVTWLDTGGVALWPGAAGPEGGFDWRRLHAPASAVGPARLASQFLRANIDPSERYVLSLPGTARYRLAADESGYENLVLAGDWTRTGWNVGCIEAAVVSGINAARAITGP